MKLLAIDPGSAQSAYVIFDNGSIEAKGIIKNDDMCNMLKAQNIYGVQNDIEKLSVEMVASYGMPVGATVFETCVWIGRFIESWGRDWEFIYRKDVKMHLCGRLTKVNDAAIRQAIMDMYGSERSIAIGTKKTPGPLYGVSKDIWSAIGVAITAEKYQVQQKSNLECAS